MAGHMTTGKPRAVLFSRQKDRKCLQGVSRASVSTLSAASDRQKPSGSAGRKRLLNWAGAVSFSAAGFLLAEALAAVLITAVMASLVYAAVTVQGRRKEAMEEKSMEMDNAYEVQLEGEDTCIYCTPETTPDIY